MSRKSIPQLCVSRFSWWWRRKLPKLLRMKWVWFKYSPEPQDVYYFGLLILGRWVLSYYKGGVSIWLASSLIIEESEPIANMSRYVHFLDYVTTRKR